ncbi:MAG: hypothetical protein AAGG08_17015 [Actinomycetota bacterium]
MGEIDRRTLLRYTWIAALSAGILAACERDDGAGVRGPLPDDDENDDE